MKIKIACRIDEDVIKKIDNMANKESRTRSAMLELILKKYFKKEVK